MSSLPARLLLIGDVHAEDRRLERALAHAGERVDAILCVGDIVDGPGDVTRCMELLRAAGARVVRGNHDRWAARGKGLDPRGYPPDVVAWLATLPATDELDTVAGRLLLCHAVGRDDMVRLLPEDTGYAIESNLALHEVLARGPALMVCGHTHQRMVRRFGATCVVNAGSLAPHREPCFAELDLTAGVVAYHLVSETAVTPAEIVPLGTA